MIIEYLGMRERNGLCCVEAAVTWEDSPRLSQRISYATHLGHAELVVDSVEPFLVAALVPAFWAGEKRILVESPVCAQLTDNLLDFIYLQQHCFYAPRPAMRIEAPPAGQRGGQPRPVGSLFSGGVDSLFTLHTNHARHGPGDARRIGYGLWHSRQDWFSIDAPELLAPLEAKARRVLPFVEATGITLVHVMSNASALWQGKNDFFWAEKWHGAGFAAAGHFLGNGMGSLMIPSSEIALAHHRWGSTPLTDGLLSSQAFQVRHVDARHSRLDKLAMLAHWPLAMCAMKVCFNTPAERLNCGSCEKCLRTRLGLMCLGLADGASAFPPGPVEPAMFAARGTKDENLLPFYAALPDRLAALGYDALAVAVQGFYDRSRQMVDTGVMSWPVYWDY